VTRKIVVGLALAGLFGFGCKKNVDPNAFDGGATAAPVVAATPSAPAADVDATAPLAALASASAAPVVAPQHKPAAKPKIDPPECVNARTFCSSPKVGTDPKVTKMCEGFKAECAAKGGKI